MYSKLFKIRLSSILIVLFGFNWYDIQVGILHSSTQQYESIGRSKIHPTWLADSSDNQAQWHIDQHDDPRYTNIQEPSIDTFRISDEQFNPIVDATRPKTFVDSPFTNGEQQKPRRPPSPPKNRHQNYPLAHNYQQPPRQVAHSAPQLVPVLKRLPPVNVKVERSSAKPPPPPKSIVDPFGALISSINPNTWNNNLRRKKAPATPKPKPKPKENNRRRNNGKSQQNRESRWKTWDDSYNKRRNRWTQTNREPPQIVKALDRWQSSFTSLRDRYTPAPKQSKGYNYNSKEEKPDLKPPQNEPETHTWIVEPIGTSVRKSHKPTIPNPEVLSYLRRTPPPERANAIQRRTTNSSPIQTQSLQTVHIPVRKNIEVDQPILLQYNGGKAPIILQLEPISGSLPIQQLLGLNQQHRHKQEHKSKKAPIRRVSERHTSSLSVHPKPTENHKIDTRPSFNPFRLPLVNKARLKKDSLHIYSSEIEDKSESSSTKENVGWLPDEQIERPHVYEHDSPRKSNRRGQRDRHAQSLEEQKNTRKQYKRRESSESPEYYSRREQKILKYNDRSESISRISLVDQIMENAESEEDRKSRRRKDKSQFKYRWNMDLEEETGEKSSSSEDNDYYNKKYDDEDSYESKSSTSSTSTSSSKSSEEDDYYEYKDKICRKPNWEPCITESKADRKFKRCCQNSEMPAGCYGACRYGISRVQLEKVFLWDKSCPASFIYDYILCASGEKNAIPCCRDKNTYADERLAQICEPYCNPADGLPEFQVSHVKCFEKIDVAFQCFWSVQPHN